MDEWLSLPFSVSYTHFQSLLDIYYICTNIKPIFNGTSISHHRSGRSENPQQSPFLPGVFSFARCLGIESVYILTCRAIFMKCWSVTAHQHVHVQNPAVLSWSDTEAAQVQTVSVVKDFIQIVTQLHTQLLTPTTFKLGCGVC